MAPLGKLPAQPNRCPGFAGSPPILRRPSPRSFLRWNPLPSRFPSPAHERFPATQLIGRWRPHRRPPRRRPHSQPPLLSNPTSLPPRNPRRLPAIRHSLQSSTPARLSRPARLARSSETNPTHRKSLHHRTGQTANRPPTLRRLIRIIRMMRMRATISCRPSPPSGPPRLQHLQHLLDQFQSTMNRRPPRRPTRPTRPEHPSPKRRTPTHKPSSIRSV